MLSEWRELLRCWKVGAVHVISYKLLVFICLFILGRKAPISLDGWEGK